jgi:hypothetical protein
MWPIDWSWGRISARAFNPRAYTAATITGIKINPLAFMFLPLAVRFTLISYI